METKSEGLIHTRGKVSFLEATQPPFKRVPGGLYLDVQWPRHLGDHLIPSSAQPRMSRPMPHPHDLTSTGPNYTQTQIYLLYSSSGTYMNSTLKLCHINLLPSSVSFISIGNLPPCYHVTCVLEKA